MANHIVGGALGPANIEQWEAGTRQHGGFDEISSVWFHGFSFEFKLKGSLRVPQGFTAPRTEPEGGLSRLSLALPVSRGMAPDDPGRMALGLRVDLGKRIEG